MAGTYTQDVNLNWPHVSLLGREQVLGLVLDLLEVGAHAECEVALHVDGACLELLELCKGDVVGDAGGEPAVAHLGRVEGDIGAWQASAGPQRGLLERRRTCTPKPGDVLEQLDDNVALGLLGGL